MKKLLVIVVLMFATVTATAQKRFEEAAKATVAEMAGVIKLSPEQSDKIYELQLKSNKKISEIREQYKGDKEKIKEEVLLVNKEGYAATKEIIGASDLKTWSEYKKEQRNKK